MTGLVLITDGSVSGVTEDAAARLGRLIRERRKSLNLTQADIQAAGGPSTATLRLIEGGKHTDFRAGTSQPLEKALQWAPGSIAAILDGGDPTLIVTANFGGSGGLRATAETPESELLRLVRVQATPPDLRTPDDAAFLARQQGAHPDFSDEVAIATHLWPVGKYLFDQLPDADDWPVKKADLAGALGTAATRMTAKLYHLVEDHPESKAELTVAYGEAALASQRFFHLHATHSPRPSDQSGFSIRQWPESSEQLLDGALTVTSVTADSVETTTEVPVDVAWPQNDAPPSEDELDLAARTAPPGYQSPGQAVRDAQDEASEAENGT